MSAMQNNKQIKRHSVAELERQLDESLVGERTSTCSRWWPWARSTPNNWTRRVCVQGRLFAPRSAGY